jgi:serine protease
MLRALPALVTLAVLAAVAFGGGSRSPSPLPDLTAPAVPGRLLIGLTDQARPLPDSVLAQRLGVEVVRRLPDLGVLVARTRDGEDALTAWARIRDLPWVSYAEPDHLLKAAFVPNDSLFSGQSAYLNQIDATAAWDVERGSDTLVVAVLDSGIDQEHEDLTGKLWTNILEIPGNGIDDDHNGCVDDVHGCSLVSPEEADPSCNAQPDAGIRDDNGHGTFVAGIIAANADNGIGISGVAPGVKVMAVKILDCLGGGTASDAAAGLLYAARMGARVANLSFGATGESITLANAIREAHDRFGMVIVTATGNEGEAKVTFPANLPQTIAVASSGDAGNPDARSPFSDWGPEVSVAAPGLNIISTVPANFCNVNWLCVQNGPYALASGTSFAAPLVSGLAALIMSHTPNLSPDEVAAIICSTAQPLPDGSTPNWDGAGRIRMRAALDQPRYYLGTAGNSKQ